MQNLKKLFNKSYYLIITLVLISLLFSCKNKSSEKITVRFWNGFTGPDGRTMLGIVKKFNKENPTIHVLMQKMDWATYYNKLFVAGIGNRAPDVFILHADSMPRFINAGFVRPIDDLVKGENGIDESDFFENIWSVAERDGKHYALPIDVHILGMYYNRKLFKEAGIVDDKGEPRPPKTKEEFLDAISKLTKDLNGDGLNDQWGYVFTWFRTNIYAMMCQFGGEFLSSDNTKCLLNSKENVEALQFCSDLIRKYKNVPPPENFDSWIGFRQGKIGIAFEGIYMLEDLKRQKDLDYGGAPIPLIGTIPATWSGSHTLCIKSGLDDKKLQAVWKFVKHVSDNSLDWAEGGQIPIRKSLIHTERFQKMKVQSEFAKQISYIRFNPIVPFTFEIMTEFDLAVEKALRGNFTPQQSLDTATQNIDKILQRYNNSKTSQ